MKHIASTALIALACGLGCAGAHAQGVDVMRRAYNDAPQLPLAPAPGTGLSGHAALGEREWQATAADKTIRTVLERWTASAGWVFSLEHWAVDRDLPVSANTTFKGDFRAAVRSLLVSTELTDLPLQPCFYSNAVLRVVKRAELCDRMAVAER